MRYSIVLSREAAGPTHAAPTYGNGATAKKENRLGTACTS